MDCFTCHACNERFVRGQELAVVDDTIYCTTHYRELLAAAAAATAVVGDVTASERDYYNSAQSRRNRKRTSGKPPTTDSQTLGTCTNVARDRRLTITLTTAITSTDPLIGQRYQLVVAHPATAGNTYTVVQLIKSISQM